MRENLDRLFAAIARKHLHIPTLEIRKNDRLDFHDVAVWGVSAALLEAYEAGAASVKKHKGESQ